MQRTPDVPSDVTRKKSICHKDKLFGNSLEIVALIWNVSEDMSLAVQHLTHKRHLAPKGKSPTAELHHHMESPSKVDLVEQLVQK